MSNQPTPTEFSTNDLRKISKGLSLLCKDIRKKNAIMPSVVHTDELCRVSNLVDQVEAMIAGV